MKKPSDILDLIKEQMADVDDSTDLNNAMGWFCDQFNSLIIAMNDYDKEKPKSVIVLDDGESLKAYKGKVYKSHYRYRHGAIYTQDNDSFIYFNPEMSNNIEFEKPNQLLLDLGYNLKEYISLVTEELSLINAQDLDARINHRYNVGGRVVNFLGVVWHDQNSAKKFPKIQIKCSWVIKTRIGLDQEFGHSINNGKTPDLKLSESISMEESFESHNFYLKLVESELPSKNKSKEKDGIVIGTLNPDDKKIIIYVKGDPVKNKEEIDHFDKIMSDYDKRNSDE
jgi:hypothetical protein